MTKSVERLAIVVFLATAAAFTVAAPARADDPVPIPPLPPAPGYGLFVPGKVGPPFGYQNFALPLFPGSDNAPVDAAGVGVGTNADQNSVGMPGSRLGVMPRMGAFGPSPSVRVAGGSGGVGVSSTTDNPAQPAGEAQLLPTGAPAGTPSS